jgi:ribosome-associated toxin RatA of RatAB toxin-antitoxin module
MAGWSAPSGWVDDPTVQQELASGQVAVRIAFQDDGSRMRVHAAVKVHATPEAIWRVLTDCEHAPNFVPGVKRCHRVQTAPDGSWDIVEQEAKYSWLMPPITCVIRAEYKRPQRIDFKLISGDLKAQEGHWTLDDPAGPEATVVEYELQVDPGFWIPRVLLRHSLRTELPAALKAVRTRSEALSATN